MWYIRGWVHFLCIKDPKWVGVMYRGGGGRLHRPARLNDRARTLGLWGSTAVLLRAYQWHHFSRTVLLEYFQTSKTFIITTDYSNTEIHFCFWSSRACCCWHYIRLYLFLHVGIIATIPLGKEEAPPHKHCCWHCLQYLKCMYALLRLQTLLT